MCFGDKERRGICRVFVSGGCIGALLTYLLWRFDSVVTSVGDVAPAAIAFSVILLILETINGIDHGVYLLIKSRKADRSSQANHMEADLRSRDPTTLPSVDIMITTYSEDWNILEKTIEGAKNIDYPHKNIWVLDDTRRQWLKERCSQEASVTSHGRTIVEKRLVTKQRIASDNCPLHLAIGRRLRPDAWNTHPDDWIFSDPKIAIVQTPQSYLNCEPFRWNLGLERAMSDEAQAFYYDDQASRDAWGVSFFCGTSAVIRRAALESIGGIPQECDTEDIFTSVILLAKRLANNLST